MTAIQSERYNRYVAPLGPALPPPPPLPVEATAVISDCKRECIAAARACIASGTVARLSNVIDRILLCATVCRGVESMIAEPDPPPAELLRDRIETCARAMSACIAACSDGQRLGPACISCRHACERGLAACHTLLAVIDGETPESQLPVAAMAAG